MTTHREGHTKGPWVSKKATLNPKDPMFYKADVISGGIRVAQVNGVGEEAANANAHLIAAAPELLEALKALTTTPRDNANAWLRSSNDAKRAIAKAESKA